MAPTLLELADDVLGRGGATVVIEGRLVPVGRADPDPFALLGVRFGAAVDAVAVTLGPGHAPVLAVDRWGEAIVVDGDHRNGSLQDAPLLLDLARRSMGLATAPPERPVGELVDAVWLDRALRASLDAPLGEPPGWSGLARLHPGGTSGPSTSPEVLRHRARTAPSWTVLRFQVAEGRARWPPVSAPLARWFDDGSFARHALAALPESEAVLADLFELLRPADAGRVDAALSRR
ncbi:MAG: hypothetical protein AAGA90_03430 [Actinomycetota bacterium]